MRAADVMCMVVVEGQVGSLQARNCVSGLAYVVLEHLIFVCFCFNDLRDLEGPEG